MGNENSNNEKKSFSFYRDGINDPEITPLVGDCLYNAVHEEKKTKSNSEVGMRNLLYCHPNDIFFRYFKEVIYFY